MQKQNLILSFVLALGTALSAHAPAQEPSADQPAPPEQAAAEPDPFGLWLGRAAIAYNAGNHERWVEALEHLHEMRPHNPDFMYQLVTGYALTGQTQNAFNMMLNMQQQGLAYDWDENEAVAPLRQYSLYDHLNTLMKEAGQPFGEAEVFATIKPDWPMPEALAFDGATGRLFVGSVRDGRIRVRDAEGAWSDFAGPERTEGLRAVFALLADSERGHLWVATGTTSQFAGFDSGEFGQTALIKLDLQSGERLGHFPVATGGEHLLGALAQASDGTLYATDSLKPMIFRLAPDAEHPQPLVAHRVFTGLRGVALSPDEKRLYVADYERGIFFIDLVDGGGYALGIPENLNLAGIDGLYGWENNLIVIQNGISPQRVVRLELDESGTRVAAIVPLVAALPEFDQPTFGTLNGRELLFLAKSHWHHVDNRGRPLAGELPEVPILATRIDTTRTRVVGQEILEQLRREGRTIGQPPPDNPEDG